MNATLETPLQRARISETPGNYTIEQQDLFKCDTPNDNDDDDDDDNSKCRMNATLKDTK